MFPRDCLNVCNTMSSVISPNCIFLAKSHQKPVRNQILMVNSLHCSSSACIHMATNVCPCQSKKIWKAYYIKVCMCTCSVFLRLKDDSSLLQLSFYFCSFGHWHAVLNKLISGNVANVAKKKSKGARKTTVFLCNECNGCTFYWHKCSILVLTAN